MWITETSELPGKKEAIKYTREELAEFGEILFMNKVLLMEYSNKPRDNGDGIIISEYEAHTLLLIKHSPNITSIELARKLGRTKGTVSPLIFKLLSAGYITKEPNSKNRREHLLNVTELGEKVCSMHHMLDAEIMRSTLEEMLKYCTIEEFETFMKVVQIRNNIYSNARLKTESDAFTLGC